MTYTEAQRTPSSVGCITGHIHTYIMIKKMTKTQHVVKVLTAAAQVFYVDVFQRENQSTKRYKIVIYIVNRSFHYIFTRFTGMLIPQQETILAQPSALSYPFLLPTRCTPQRHNVCSSQSNPPVQLLLNESTPEHLMFYVFTE